MDEPDVIVCAGGGGVGKTTTSAAIALAAARSGRRVLIVSIDPARRLADAMGVDLGTQVSELAVDAGRGRLFGLMPDPKHGMRTFVEILFEEEPEALSRLLDNRLYQALEDSVPGIHELAAINLTWRAVVENEIEVVVIDTAPSRNAIDFTDYPRRLAKLLRGRAIAWLSGLAQRANPLAPESKMGRAERLLTRVLGPVVSEIAGLFTELARVRRRFVSLNEQTDALLLGSQTRYFLVAGPSGAAEDDVEYLAQRLNKLGLRPTTLVINSAFVPKRHWIEVLHHSEQATPAIREVLRTLTEEDRARETAADRVANGFSAQHPEVEHIRLPFVETIEPEDIVHTLSECFKPQRWTGQSKT